MTGRPVLICKAVLLEAVDQNSRISRIGTTLDFVFERRGIGSRTLQIQLTKHIGLPRVCPFTGRRDRGPSMLQACSTLFVVNRDTLYLTSLPTTGSLNYSTVTNWFRSGVFFGRRFLPLLSTPESCTFVCFFPRFKV